MQPLNTVCCFFYTQAEITSIVVAYAVAMPACHSRRHMDNHYYMSFVAIARAMRDAMENCEFNVYPLPRTLAGPCTAPVDPFRKNSKV